MFTTEKSFEYEIPSTRNQAFQSPAYPAWVTNRKGYRREQLNRETIQLIDNYGSLMQQTTKGVSKLGALLLVGGALAAMSFAVPAQGQNLLKAGTAESNASAANDNSRVIAMMNKGLDDSIIVAKIKSSNWTFKLSDDDLVALRKTGLSAPVVAAMVDSSATEVARVSIDQQKLSLDTMGQAKTGGRLLNNMTGDLTPLKENAYLQGPVSNVSVSPMPEILITLPKGDSIGNYILVKMNQKSDRRELTVGTGGGVGNGRTGLGSSSAVKSVRVIARGDNTFQLQPATPLKEGQYMIYVIGSSDERKDIYGKGYDFAVLR